MSDTPILDVLRTHARLQIHPLRLDWRDEHGDGFYSARCMCGAAMRNFTARMLASAERAHRWRAIVRGYVGKCGRPGVGGRMLPFCIRCGLLHSAGWIDDRNARCTKLGRTTDAPNGGILCAGCLLDAIMRMDEDDDAAAGRERSGT